MVQIYCATFKDWWFFHSCYLVEKTLLTFKVRPVSWIFLPTFVHDGLDVWQPATFISHNFQVTLERSYSIYHIIHHHKISVTSIRKLARQDFPYSDPKAVDIPFSAVWNVTIFQYFWWHITNSAFWVTIRWLSHAASKQISTNLRQTKICQLNKKWQLNESILQKESLCLWSSLVWQQCTYHHIFLTLSSAYLNLKSTIEEDICWFEV